MNVSDAIHLKRAERKFTDQSLAEETILAILKDLSECGEWAGHLAGAALGVAILHPDPGEKFQILFDIGQATSHVS